VGLYDYITPYSDHINGERTCPFGVSSELDVDGPICSVQGAYGASQFDAVELDAQGLVTQPDDPPRFLLRLDTAGHGTFIDKYSMDFNITCPADPTLPCSCVNDFVSSYFGPAECGQLSGDRAPAEELIFANAQSFFGAFLQGNPSAWQVASGDQTLGSPATVTGHLFADWDRDASDAACEVPAGDLLGDGVLDSVDNCTLVCNPDQADTDGDGVGDACAP
jgi:hypothetical protein